MELVGEGVLPAAPASVFPWIADLATYPRWLGFVLSARPAGAADDAAGDSVWTVDIGARIGPLKKAKRVRMARVSCDEDSGVVCFERQEDDGREHSAWVLDGRVEPVAGEGDSSRLTMRLHYGGSKWLPGLDLVLRDEVRRATGRLARLVG